MRRSLTGIVAVTIGLALVLTACGDPDQAEPPPAGPPTGHSTVAPPAEPGSPEHNWEGSVDRDFETGEVTAPGFNDLIDAESPDWATDPLTTATVLLHLDTAEGQIEADVEPGDGDPVVVVTQSQLPDDSVAAFRYRIVLTEGADGRYRFASGQIAWRCQPERGQQDFGTDVCL